MREYCLDTPRKRLGLVVLSTDETLEDEARTVLSGRDVSLLHSRIELETEVTPEKLLAMKDRIPEAARLLPAGLAAVAYGCTSASVLIGPEMVERQIRAEHPGVSVTNPISAVIAALGALSVSRIGLVTPYAADVAGPMRAFLAARGIATVHEVSFGESDDRRVARMAESSTLAAILEAGTADGAEAVFVSCTNLRAFGIIEDAETRLGLPVISSNLALIWDVLRRGDIDARAWGPGRLFSL